MSKPQGRISALALAAAVALGVASSDAQALALGRISVQSALGEPLRVDIDIPEINAEEASSLRANVASPQAFRAAGLEYSPALSGVEITLQRRPDGRYFLRLVSSRPVNEPFVDLILETTWSSGRIVRDYTMLFDPPNLRQGTAPLSAQVSPVPAPGAVQGTPTPRAAPAARATAPAAPRARSAATPSPAPAPVPRPAAAPTPSGDGKQITAKDGDNATRIAKANLHANISLDQMLIALLRANPDAFAGNNINRLKSGAVLEIPSAAQAAEVDAKEANQVLVAQSRDFDEFRRRLAEGLPVRDMRSADRVSSGRVQATVEDKKPASTSPDRLTLSKGAIQGKAGEDKIARDRAAQEAATRVAELNKNISELNKLGTATGGGSAPGAAASAAKPGIAVPAGVAASAARPASAPAPVVAPAAQAVPAAAAPPASAPAPAVSPVAAASAPSAAASAPVLTPPAASASMPVAAASAAEAPAAAAPAASAPAPAKPRPRVAPVVPPPETSVLDDLLENPLIPAAGVGVLAMLLGLGFYKLRQRRKATQVDSSFLESRLQPDSFFGASGGQRIDTAEGASQTGSSMVYSPSQLDAAGDVDPVAEADVYLAYGRDLQAEEILKEAMRTNPGRVAIHAKLLEIYAKRRDAKAFEVVATEAYSLTHGEGPEWEHICELGRELDPSNPMYRPGGQPGDDARAAAAAAVTAPGAFGATTAVPAVAPEAAAPAVDLDLDLDFSLGDDQPAAARAATPVTERTVAMDQRTQAVEAAPPMPSLDMDFGKPAAAPQPEPVRLDAPDLTLNENSLNFSASPVPAPAPQVAAAAPAAADAGMIEFDLGALSLDLDNGKKKEAGDTDESPLSTAGAPLITADLSGDDSSDPLATKLALAEEFNAIGDPDGARSLAEEVVAEASGELKSRAQRLLAEIG
jgi:pilus assembly protein FimV